MSVYLNWNCWYEAWYRFRALEAPLVTTCNFVSGEAVPIPTLPALNITGLLPSTNTAFVADPPDSLTYNVLH